MLDALMKLRKGKFDPADVGADAKRKIFIARYTEVLEANFKQPSEDFQRMLMDLADVDGRRTTRLLEEHAPIVKDALDVFLDRKILERIGFANREDIVKMQAGHDPAAVAGAPAPDVVEEARPGGDGVTRETEIKIFDHVKTRLAFLVDDDALFRAVQNLEWVDYKTRFAVYYKQERKGKLFNFQEGPNGEYRFDFPF